MSVHEIKRFLSGARHALPIAALICSATPITQGAELSKGGACYSIQSLRRFAGAYAEAYRIRQFYGPKVQQATDPQQAEKLMEEADKSVNQAINDRGLDVSSFFMLEESLFGPRNTESTYTGRDMLSPEEMNLIVKLVHEEMARTQSTK